MTRPERGRQGTGDARSEQVSELLQRALSQPGVREVMEVYDHWQARNRAAEPYMRAMSAKQIVSLSNCSEPSGEQIY